MIIASALAYFLIGALIAKRLNGWIFILIWPIPVTFWAIIWILWLMGAKFGQ